MRLDFSIFFPEPSKCASTVTKSPSQGDLEKVLRGHDQTDENKSILGDVTAGTRGTAVLVRGPGQTRFPVPSTRRRPDPGESDFAGYAGHSGHIQDPNELTADTPDFHGGHSGHNPRANSDRGELDVSKEFLAWLQERCVENLNGWGAVSVLQGDYRVMTQKDVTRHQFEAMLTAQGLDLERGFAVGVVLREDFDSIVCR